MEDVVKKELDSPIEEKPEKATLLKQNPMSKPFTPKRRYILISRNLASVDRSSNARIPPNVSPRSQCVPRAKEPAYLEITHRVCLICQTVKPMAQLRLTSDCNDKLFLILFGISRRSIEVFLSNNTYKQFPFFSCRSHFPEAAVEIVKMFGVSRASMIHRARRQKVSEVEMYARHVTRNNNLTGQILYSSAYTFVLKYSKETAPIGPIVKEEDIPYEKTVECKSDVKVEPIVPKCFRQPRKQRFEKEENECMSSMLRIIRREPLHLPTDHAPYPAVVLQKPIKCSYCLEIHEKEMMLHVPKTKARIALWAEHLGEEFGDRLKTNPVNYMCRKHFSKFDLSPRGRLRRNVMPNFVPQPEVHTFKIHGDQFVKVEEKAIKIEAAENSDVDIEN